MNNSLKKFAIEIGADIPELDLHTYYPNEVEYLIDQFLYKQLENKESSVRIVCGIGNGVLKKEVKKILEKYKSIDEIAEESGAWIAFF